jgi:hypothetical protein
MAGEIPIHEILLYDKWPGQPNPNLGVPAGGWDSTIYWCCQTTATVPPGTKASAYQDHTYAAGQYTMCYMMFLETSDFAEDCGAISEGVGICGDIGGECADSIDVLAASYGTVNDITESKWWIVTNSFVNGDSSATGRVAIPASDLSTGEFGWCWVGGVCPVADVTKFDKQGSGAGSEMLGNGSIAMGSKLMPANDGTGGVVLDVWDGTFEYTPAGLALEADA